MKTFLLVALLLALHTALISGDHEPPITTTTNSGWNCASCCGSSCTRSCLPGNSGCYDDGYYYGLKSCGGCADKRAADAVACGSCCGDYCDSWCTGSICTSNDGYYSNMQSCEGCAEKRAAEYAAAVQEADDDDYQLVDDDGRTDGYGYDPLNIMMFCLVSSIFCMFFRAWQLNKKSGQAQVFANTTATHCEGSVTLNGDVSGHLWALFAVTLKMDVYQPKVRAIRYLKKKNPSTYLFKIYLPI